MPKSCTIFGCLDIILSMTRWGDDDVKTYRKFLNLRKSSVKDYDNTTIASVPSQARSSAHFHRTIASICSSSLDLISDSNNIVFLDHILYIPSRIIAFVVLSRHRDDFKITIFKDSVLMHVRLSAMKITSMSIHLTRQDCPFSMYTVGYLQFRDCG